MLRYDIAEKGEDFVVLRISGELAGDLEVDRLHDVLEEHYVDDGVRVIRVDLQDVTFLSLEGVAMLVDLLQESKERGKRFVVEGIRGQPRSKLTITGVLPVVAPDEG
ncbi:MAG TPA: STAS domain-containing protein [Actinomycetota bacterium]|nr:STAS domain-containing protein [Actinomycetota bacterium]